MIHIYWIEPYAEDKNIGKEYNNVVTFFPKHSWIGITDHDMMFLNPYQKRWISEIIGDGDYELYGCLTNRLKSTEQAPYRGRPLYEPNLTQETDILRHKQVANTLYDTYHNQIIPTNDVIAGMMMVFNKDTWERVGGFAEGRIDYDIDFSNKIEKKGIMQGIYVFHDYRLPHHLEDAAFFTNHLKT